MPLPALPLDALLTGRARPFTRPGSRSGIAKSPRDGALRVTLSAWRVTNKATCASMAASRRRSTIIRANTTPPGSPNWANTPC